MKSAVLHLLSQEKYKHLGHTWYPLWVIQVQQTFDSWLLIASKPSWHLTTHATQILQSGKPGHTDKYDCNSGRVSDPPQSGHHLITKAAVTGCPTCLRWIQNHSFLVSGNPCFNVTEETAISPWLWLSRLTKSHPFPGWLYFPHLSTVCTQGSSLLTNTWPKP